MAGGAIPVQGQATIGKRVSAPHHADVFTAVQPLVRKGDGFASLLARAKVCQCRREVAHGQIGGCGFQQAPRVAGGQRNDPQRHAGRAGFGDVYQAGHQCGCGGIGHGENEGGGGGGRFEAARRQRRLKGSQRIAHAGPQGQGADGRFHAGAGPAHQFIAQRRTQAAQGIAHGRLRQRQVAGCARQAAFGHDLVEHPQQVQVQGAEVGLWRGRRYQYGFLLLGLHHHQREYNTS